MEKILYFLFIIILCTLSSRAQITYSIRNINLQGMGFVSGITSDAQSKDIYIRTDVGGAYRWDPVLLRWIPITDFQVDSYDVEAIAINPAKNNEVFIVVGSAEAGMLYKSSDRGDTWTKLTGFSAFADGNAAWRNAGPRLAIDPNSNSNLMFYASRKNGLQKSVDGGASWISIAAGKLPYGNEENGGQNFVLIDKNSGNENTASSIIYVGVTGRGIYKSTDGGATFSVLSGGPDASSNFPICADISSTGLLYVTYTGEWDGGPGAVFRYSGSGTGSDITPKPSNGNGFAGIDVCDSDPGKIITFTWRWAMETNGVQGIHYSTDGGNTWKNKSFLLSNFNDTEWWNSNDMQWTYSAGIMFDPSDSEKVWFTHGYGVMAARDITVPNPVYDSPMAGLEELVVLQVFSAPSPNNKKLYAAVADVRGFIIQDTDLVPASNIDKGAWGMTSCFDYCSTDPNFIARVGDNQYYWKSPGWGYKTSDGGNKWTSFGSKPANAAHGNIAVSATDKNRMVWAPINYSWCGWNVLPHYTGDGGSSWNPVSGIPVGDNDCTEEWSGSRFLAADRVNGSTFYYYTFSQGKSNFYRSTDGGQSFSLVTGIDLPGNYKMKMLSNPEKEGNLLLCTRNGSALYKTTDRGTSWNTIPEVTKCYTFGFGKAISPSVENTIFLSGIVDGEEGIFYSTNSGVSWNQATVGRFPAGAIDITGDLKEEYTFYLATSGRGIFYGFASEGLVNSVINIPDSPSNEDSGYKVNLYPNPVFASDRLVTICSDKLLSGIIVITDVGGNVRFKGIMENSPMYLNLKNLNAGVYLVNISGNNTCFKSRIVLY